MKVEHNPHTTLGKWSLGIIFSVAFFGILSQIVRCKCCNMDWKTANLLLIRDIHKYLAYSIIIGVQITVSAGIMNYTTWNNKMNEGYIFIGCSNFLFFAILLTSEVVYRYQAKTEVQF